MKDSLAAGDGERDGELDGVAGEKTEPAGVALDQRARGISGIEEAMLVYEDCAEDFSAGLVMGPEHLESGVELIVGEVRPGDMNGILIPFFRGVDADAFAGEGLEPLVGAGLNRFPTEHDPLRPRHPEADAGGRIWSKGVVE